MLLLLFFIVINTLLYLVSVRAYFSNANPIFLIVSTCWYFVVVCGTFTLFWALGSPYNTDQLYGGTLIMAALTASDFFLARRNLSKLDATLRLEVSLAWGAAAATFGLIGLHLYAADAVPAFQLTNMDLFGDGIARQRQNFTKELEAPSIVKMSFNWISTLFLPFVSYVLLKKRYFITCATYILIVVMYSLLSTAKFPALFSILFVGLLAVSLFRKELEKTAVVAIIAFMILANGLVIWKTTDLQSYAKLFPGLENSIPLSPANHSGGTGTTPRFTPVDVLRVPNASPPPTVNKYVDYFLYRLFLAPPDVTLRWYNFYGTLEKKFRNLREFDPSIRGHKDFQHASNKVGRWAYYARFPQKYKSFANAYSSADADAYSFGGLTIVLLIAVIIFFMRVIPLFLVQTELGYFCFFLIQISLALMLFQASIQAILISQGMFIALGMIGLIWFGRIAKGRFSDNRENPQD